MFKPLFVINKLIIPWIVESEGTILMIIESIGYNSTPTFYCQVAIEI